MEQGDTLIVYCRKVRLRARHEETLRNVQQIRLKINLLFFIVLLALMKVREALNHLCEALTYALRSECLVTT
jgi:hypothetical protein